jgi:uncharacterized membrane protein YhaH (DUF805 family)|tara:strand:- start:54 stop:581 length:528 start_codon:yes stop_codon:yes gene_type:complete
MINNVEWYFGPLKKYVEFSGRASRKEFWLFALWNWVIFFVLLLVLFPLAIIHWLGTLLPYWAVWVRRLHDTNRSAWWLLFSVIPVVGTIGMTVMMCSKGTDGENDYGLDPLAVPALDAGPLPQATLKPSTKPSATKVVQQGSMADELKKLSELKESGILTEAEFEEQKTKLLKSD